jgi:uncharacterized repeat protein (TIGR01451 family)
MTGKDFLSRWFAGKNLKTQTPPARKARRPRRARLRLEELEARCLPALLTGGTLVQFDASGTHALGSGVHSASVAFGPAGEVLEVVTTDGNVTQFDATGAHPLGGGVQSASAAFGPAGEVLEVVFTNGTLVQYDAFGAHPLGGGVQSASVAFGPAGEVLEVVFTNGTLVQLDAFGAHPLNASLSLPNSVQSAGVALGPAGEVLVVTYLPTASVGLDNANPKNLVVQDTTSAAGNSESLTMQADTGNQQYVIGDPNTTFSATVGTVSADGHTVFVPFASVPGQIVFGSNLGNDTLTVDFSKGSWAGKTIAFNGGSGSNTLNLTGEAFTKEQFDYTSAHNGDVQLSDGSGTTTINYTNLKPLTNTGTAANIVFNLPQGDGDNQTILEDNGTPGDNMSQLRTQNGTFDTTQFTNPTTSLTVNTGNDGETVTFAHLDPAYNPTSGTTITGGTGQDTLRVDFRSGTNVIPTGGITFNGGADNGEADIVTAGYTATGVTHNYTDSHSGSIVVDGRTLTYNGLSQTRGIFDPLAASTRMFNFSSTISNNITLGDDPTANNGISRISSTASNPTTDFANPTTSVTVDLGNAGDTIAAGPLDAVSPPPATDLNGGTSSDTFNVTPSTGATVNVDGNLPNPPALPGDTLNVNIPPGSNPMLTAVATPTGFTGNYPFLAGGFRPVSFTRIETLNPSTVDLSITMDDGDGTEGETPGTAVTYTITATNRGTRGVTGVTITDLFPMSMPPSTGPGFTSDSFTSSVTGGATGNTAAGMGNIIDTVTMPAGSTITYTVTAPINPSSLGTLSNTATIAPPMGVTDANPANNSATDADTLTPQADLAVTQTGPATMTAGTNLTYTVTVTDNGPSNAQSVRLNDVVPAGTTFVRETHRSGWTATTPAVGGTGTVTESSGTLPAGTSATFVIVVHAKASDPNGFLIANTATAGSGTFDRNGGNNTSMSTTRVATSADVSVTRTGSAMATAGSNLTYTITVTDNGPSDAQNVQLNDAVPGGTTFVSESHLLGWTAMTPPAGSGAGTVTESIGKLSAGASATFVIVVHAPASDANGFKINNTALVSTTTTDPNPNNNSSTSTTPVATAAHLKVTIKAPFVVAAGSNVTYTVTLSNTGPSDGLMVRLTDMVPGGTTFVSETHPSGWTAMPPPVGGTGTLTESTGALAAGASATFVIVVHANASDPLGFVIANLAAVTSSTFDPLSPNNTFKVNSYVVGAAQL